LDIEPYWLARCARHPMVPEADRQFAGRI
jgi:hypothetical protein